MPKALGLNKAKLSRKPARKGPRSHASAQARMRLFVEAYIGNGGVGSYAAIDAGYSEKSAEQQAVRLLKDPRVADMLKVRREEIAQMFKLATEDVLRSMARGILFDPRKLLDKNGKPKPLHLLDDDTALAIEGAEITKDAEGNVTYKVKAGNKGAAREQYAKHLGLFKEDHKQKNDPLTELLRQLGGAVIGVAKADGNDD